MGSLFQAHHCGETKLVLIYGTSTGIHRLQELITSTALFKQINSQES
jgi:hypothetical protein